MSAPRRIAVVIDKNWRFQQFAEGFPEGTKVHMTRLRAEAPNGDLYIGIIWPEQVKGHEFDEAIFQFGSRETMVAAQQRVRPKS